ncbi:MAG TPA: hypothetical protein VK957_12855 [Lunatimonas sp.]|nr:hypothetical protein [Lunatimonas sp.]
MNRIIPVLTFLFLVSVFVGCGGSNPRENEVLPDMELILVDSLTFDMMKTLHLIDYHKVKELYLMSAPGLEGVYYIINKNGDIVVENSLADGPNGFGMVLHRGGFVGEEIVIVGTNRIYVYDMNLERQRDFPFEQEVRYRLVHFVRDYLATYAMEGQEWPIVNISEEILPKYPEDYFDTLNLLHLVNPKNGEIRKGGKLDEASVFKHGIFYPYIDKPVVFSDANSSAVSVILGGDSVLYQFDPAKNFELVNRLAVPRLLPDRKEPIPMSEAGRETFQKIRPAVAFSGSFFNIMGKGNSFLVAYKTGGDKSLWSEAMTEEAGEKYSSTINTYYIPIKDGEVNGKPILWDKPGDLVLGVGENRFIQYVRDQADLHEFEKEYQCYYIYELREVE